MIRCELSHTINTATDDLYYGELRTRFVMPQIPFIGLKVQFPVISNSESTPEYQELILHEYLSTGIAILEDVTYSVEDNCCYLSSYEMVEDRETLDVAVKQWHFGYKFSIEEYHNKLMP